MVLEGLKGTKECGTGHLVFEMRLMRRVGQRKKVRRFACSRRRR
jgi:hypothetical protein